MSGGSKVSTSEKEPWKEQQDYLIKGFKQASDVYGKGPADYYPGSSLAGFTPAQEAAQKGVAGYVSGPRAAGQQAYAEGASTRGLSGEVDLTKFNPMMDSLSSQMKSQLTGSILPGIRQSMVEYQPGGSSRGDLVQSQAISAANQQMLNKASEMYGGAYQGAQDRAVQWGSQYPSIMNAPLSMYGALGDVGAEQRAMGQETIDRDMAKYQYDSTAPQQQLANYMSMISGDYGGTTTQTTPGPSGLQQMGSLVGMLGSIGKFSDVRLKENIKPLGINNGFGVYEFNYLWSPDKHVGYMAQEVEKTRPDAVFTVRGYKAINYGAL